MHAVPPVPNPAHKPWRTWPRGCACCQLRMATEHPRRRRDERASDRHLRSDGGREYAAAGRRHERRAYMRSWASPWLTGSMPGPPVGLDWRHATRPRETGPARSCGPGRRIIHRRSGRTSEAAAAGSAQSGRSRPAMRDVTQQETLRSRRDAARTARRPRGRGPSFEHTDTEPLQRSLSAGKPWYGCMPPLIRAMLIWAMRTRAVAGPARC